MDAKKAFLSLFILSSLAFMASFVFLKGSYVYVAVLHTGMLFIALYLLWGGSWKETMERLGIPGDMKRNAIWFVAGWAMLFAGLGALLVFSNFFGLNDSGKVTERAAELPQYIALMAILFVPFSEEFFFRGWLCPAMEAQARSLLAMARPAGGGDSGAPWLAPAVGVIGSSVIFSLSHMAYGSVMELMGTFVVGIIFAFIYRRSGSIVPPLALHLSYNLLSLAVMRGVI